MLLAPLAPLSRDSQLAAEIKGLVAGGDRDAARERYGELVAHQQRRAVRIAYQYLRDAHDADEAVQDAFVKVFTHITSYREDLPFEVWFTRILVNACLDLRKSRSRRLRWSVPMSSNARHRAERPGDAGADARAAAGVEGARERDYGGAWNRFPIASARCSRSATSRSRRPPRSARRLA